jgi:hypothetical protein
MLSPAEALARLVLGHITLNQCQKLADAGFDFDQINKMVPGLVPEWNKSGDLLRAKFAALLGEDTPGTAPMVTITSASIVVDGENR